MTNPDPKGPPCCSHIPNCELFPRFNLRSALGVWQTLYCRGHFEDCARRRLALQGRPVPPTLLPNGKELDLNLLRISA